MSLRARGLGKALGGRWVLRGCDLDLHPGTWLGVLGPNGAGKTTLLRLLATVQAPDEGALYWRGVPVGHGARLRRRLGYLPQTFALPSLPTVAASLSYLAALKGIPLADQGPACTRALAWAQAGAAAQERAERLSAGMLRRVGLAQAMLGDPAVLVLDEPDAGLDPARRADLAGRLRALAARGRLVVAASSDPAFLEAADAVLLLEGGRAAGPWTVDDLRQGRAGPAATGAPEPVTSLCEAYVRWRTSRRTEA